ncbi:hypothetical protein MUG78_04910 [Gordonia alkaliphila]|uniref:Secreted protein n=1 Tax=Gordonia alkaliphila TaxID=1053547 RepID=A0ABP8ZAS9_9ACTN|nr:hypothetical protein [Gordonia alkaliphila]MCK0438821.1 hypothetical protein [Gordonia alkaliphila]
MISRATTAVVAGCAAAAVAATLSAAPANAAPQGRVDPGIGFFSVNHGVGCSYSMTVPVNASGLVSFYDWKGRGYPPLLIGRAMASGGNAAVTWWPKRQGLRNVYAVQNGKKSPITKVRVTQGYGSGGLCFAFP